MHMKSALNRFIKNYGNTFSVLRNNEISHQVDGLLQSDKESNEPPYIHLLPESDVIDGDILVMNSTQEEYFIDQSVVNSFRNQPTERKAFYLTKKQLNESKQVQPNVTYNINNAHNSIIGSQTNATINLGIDFDELKSIINASDSIDKEELLELIGSLEQTDEIEKGKFARFAEVLQKNSWVSAPLGQALIKCLFT
ncbi:hypothetical protein [Bacillus wiedmannii]|uniref:hypothetical protein n=1 Tax=Bacillus wiedmannii TaxID=1890302 RepID=UPI000BFE46B2|nr:hypothetical protein [Bacillus wiedmannii]PHB61723.1 hypothetical protein COE87_18880 [Bacillus wiedmannii]